jgi:hypothetical protein
VLLRRPPAPATRNAGGQGSAEGESARKYEQLKNTETSERQGPGFDPGVARVDGIDWTASGEGGFVWVGDWAGDVRAATELIVIAKVPVAGSPTAIPKEAIPEAVGVPEIVPLGFSVSPAGSEPVVSVQVYGPPVPPLATRVAE